MAQGQKKFTNVTGLRLPYLAQGASQAIEDTGVLVTALALVPSVPIALEVYSLIRKPRMTIMHELVKTTQRNLHLQDKAELLRRDEEMSALRGSGIEQNSGTKAKHPDRWADRECQDFMYGVDVMKVCVEQWNQLVIQAERNLKGEPNIEGAESCLTVAQNTSQRKDESTAKVSQPKKRGRPSRGGTSTADQPLYRPRKKRTANARSKDLMTRQVLMGKGDLDHDALVSTIPDELLKLPLSANAPLLRNIEAGMM